MPGPVNLYYDGAECPDCGDPIPDEMEEGDECENCGHVFWEDRPADPEDRPADPEDE